MDQIGDKSLPSLTQTITSSNFLKKATKLLLSLSLCSFLFSSYSSMYSFILHSMNNSHSTFPFFAIDKNYVFLVFNGILVFIAKTSGSLLHFDSNDNPSIKNIYEEEEVQMITTQSETLESEEGKEYHHHDHDHEGYLMKEEEEGEIIRLSDDQLKEESDEQDGKSGNLFDDHEEGEEQEGKSGNLFDDDHEEGEEEQQHERIFCIEESPENEIELRDGPDGDCGYMMLKKKDVKQKEMNIGVLSTEELNKKFDEFIRRMKAEIRIEAQRTLIMV